MGMSKKRRDALKRDHPICYFCATAPTEVPDHVPSRQCFKGRVGPEGFEFPACDRCNRKSSQFEQAVALYMRMADQSDDAHIDEDAKKLVKGVVNNNPELVPRMNLTAREARQAHRKMGSKPGWNHTYSESVFEIPEAGHAAFVAFSRRLACALYYKEVGHPVPLDYRIATAWVQIKDQRARMLEEVNELLPQTTLANRRNTNIGDQFEYRWSYEPEKVFAFIAKFRKSFYLQGVVVEPSFDPAQTGHWPVHRDDI